MTKHLLKQVENKRRMAGEVPAGEGQLYVRLMAGRPSLKLTGELLLSLQAAGVAGAQLVLPFSDPMAARALLQQAGDAALATGTTMEGVFELLEQLRECLRIRITLVVYMNPLLNYGYAAFFQRCQQVGVADLLVVDLPFEEREELLPYSKASGVKLLTTFAISQPQRLQALAGQAEGLAYITGGNRRPEVDRKRVDQLAAQVRPLVQLPLLIGYGGSSVEEAVAYAQQGEGLLLENYFLELVERRGSRALSEAVTLVEQLRENWRKEKSKKQEKDSL